MCNPAQHYAMNFSNATEDPLTASPSPTPTDTPTEPSGAYETHELPRQYFTVVIFVTTAYIIFLSALAIVLSCLVRQLRSLVVKTRPPMNGQFKIHKAAVKKEKTPKPDSELEDGSDDECRT